MGSAEVGRDTEDSPREERIYDRCRARLAGVLSSKLPSKCQKAREVLFLLPDLAVLIFRLLKHPRVPARAKVKLGLAFAYLGLPVDVLPDFVPVLGQLDDLIIATTAVHNILKTTPEEVVRENWSGCLDVLEGVQRVLDMVSDIMGNRLTRMIIRGCVRR
jgi:uncharacterized membrane protein YkvA (DUF1232 family)